tara:strand:+ start:7323 stop:7907 length:585 start_codon:yes stop_codon:yes gene_type:complete
MTSNLAGTANTIAQGQGIVTGIVIILFTAVFSLVFITFGYSAMNKKSSWISQTAKIINAQVHKNCHTRYKYGQEITKCRSPTTAVTYEYEIDGQTYQGSTSLSGTKKEGSTIKIEYNPVNPSVSRKTSLTKNQGIIMFGIGIFSGLISLSVMGCMTSQNCRAGLGLGSMITGGSSNNNGGFMSGIPMLINAFKN